MLQVKLLLDEKEFRLKLFQAIKNVLGFNNFAWEENKQREAKIDLIRKILQ